MAIEEDVGFMTAPGHRASTTYRRTFTRWGYVVAGGAFASGGLAGSAPAQSTTNQSAVTSVAPACRPDTPSGVGLTSGRRIRSVGIVTRAPRSLPGAAALMDNLHARTRDATVRQRLLFAAGDSVDTLRVLESLRRLRQLHYLTDVALTAADCPDGSVALVVETQDAWSARPTFSVQASGTARLGLEERNLLGSGRSARIYVRSDAGRLGVGAGYADPWVLGSNLSASVVRNSYRDGVAWQGMVATRARSVFDPWNAQLTAVHLALRTPHGRGGVVGDSVYRDVARVLVDRRLTASPRGVTSLLIGAEVERTAVAAGPNALIVGPGRVRRTFTGLDVGAARRSASYSQNWWLLEGDAAIPASRDATSGGSVAELPVGFEGEAVIGLGRDLASQRRALHIDLWSGRIWTPQDRWVVTTDAWASGFRIGPEWTAASARASIGVMHPARGGLWTARLTGEQLTGPDPDVRALAAVDPTLRALSSRNGLAETAVAASLERSARLTDIGRTYALDAALFGAGSMRWDAASPHGAIGTERLSVGVVGAGLRLSPKRFGRETLGLNVGFPVLHSSAVRGVPFVELRIVRSLTADRQRDGRVPQ